MQYFVGRLNQDFKFEQVEGTKTILYEKNTETLENISEKTVYLFADGCKKIEIPFRIIEGTITATQEKIVLISNIPQTELDGLDITEIYKRRWKIEQFFRFIKQEMRLKHFFSRDWNGIQNMVYIILIAAILLIAFMYFNKRKDYKISKLSFKNQLQDEIIRDVVIHCGGDPEKINSF